jgi:hypothetical protein
MKTRLMIAAFAAIAGAAGIYLIRRFRARRNHPEPVKKNHHLTKAFARAKNYTVSN